MELKKLEDIFQNLTTSILTKLDKDSGVRLAWPPDGMPAWKQTEDRVFLRVVEDDDPYNKQRDREYKEYDPISFKEKLIYTRVIRVDWIAYGPNSYEYIQEVRDAILSQSNHDVLAVNNLYLIPDMVAPVRTPELFEGAWWSRVDMYLRFNEQVAYEAIVPMIASAKVMVKSMDLETDVIVEE